MEGSCIGFWKSKANSTFCKVVKQKGEACFCVWKLLFYQQPCAKAQEFCKAEFLDSTSVLALECFFVYGTGVLISEFSASRIRELWLTAFDKSEFFRCQSVPGPPMPCFVAQSFAFAVFATLICQINSVFPCKDTKAQEFGLCRILGQYAGLLWRDLVLAFGKARQTLLFAK